MNVNKKPFIIIGAVTIALIILILILVLVLGDKPKVENINYVVGQDDSNNISNSTLNEVNNAVNSDTNEVDENNTTNEINPNPENQITGEITYAQADDNVKIPIPPKFHFVEGGTKNGAVIEDDSGNQFVWIPVNNISSYARQIFVNNGEGVSREDIEKLNLKDVNSYNQEFNDSVMTYKGFYVARFEAGKEENVETPVSKKGVSAWTQVVWQKARDLAMNMYVTNDYFQTDLINSYAWDTICNWVRNSGTGINIDDSTSYGNYQNSIDGLNRASITGGSERWKTNNIYDMAGNVWEYTTEEYGDHEKYHIGRGGGYWNYGNLYPISTRATSEDSSDFNIGFRVVMYLK